MCAPSESCGETRNGCRCSGRVRSLFPNLISGSRFDWLARYFVSLCCSVLGASVVYPEMLLLLYTRLVQQQQELRKWTEDWIFASDVMRCNNRLFPSQNYLSIYDSSILKFAGVQGVQARRKVALFKVAALCSLSLRERTKR